MDNEFIIPGQDKTGGPYFLTHSVGPMTRKGMEYLGEHYVGPWRDKGGEAWPYWLTVLDRFNGALSRLLGGAQDEFCPQANLSSAMTKYLLALPCQKKLKILMHGHAFPSMGFVLKGLASAGYELELIPAQLPANDANVWAERLTDDIDAVLITHVHSNTGVMSPVAEIAKIARARNIKVMVDVAQSAGIIPVHLPDWDADAVFGSCVKWLCGGPGAGWMWVNANGLSDLKPIDVGWFSHENPFEFDIHNFRYAASAKRFWGGTPSVAPYAAAFGGIETILDIGVENIRAHNLKLMQTVLPEKDFSQNGGTICYDGGDNADRIETGLKAMNAKFDRRGNTLRLSMGINITDVNAIAVRDLLNIG